MPNVKLTKRSVEAAKPDDRDVILWDTELKGFGCKVTPAGRRVYFAYYRTRDGQQRRPMIGTHDPLTCEKARETARKWLQDARDGKDPSTERKTARKAQTVAELSASYLRDYAEPYKKPSSVAEDRRLIEKRIKPALGARKVQSVSRADVMDLHRKLRATPYEANRALALLSKMFSLAESWGVRQDGTNPCRHIERYAERKRGRFLGVAELGTLGTALADAEKAGTETTDVIVALRLLLFTGARMGEILSLEWRDIDPEHGVIRFRDSKTGAKTIPLTPPVVEALGRLTEGEAGDFILHGSSGEDAPLTVSMLEKAWTRIREAASLADVRIHDLRHSHASMGAASGLSLPMIGKLLGHTQAATTARYAHLAADPVKQAAELVSGRMAAAMKGRKGKVLPMRSRAG